MIVIADTNVFIDSLFHKDEYCTEILRMEHKGELSFIMTDDMSEELIKTVFLHAQELGFLLTDFQNPFYILSRAFRRTLPANSTNNSTYCRDPKDDMFIRCAVDESIELIISSDIHLREKTGSIQNNSGKEIIILRPKEFLHYYTHLQLSMVAEKINKRRL